MAVALLVLLPLVLIALAAGAAWISVARSHLRIAADGITVHNAGTEPITVPLDRVVCFEGVPAVGFMTFVRPSTATLVLDDGTRIPVRRPVDADAGPGVDALNERLDRLRPT